MIDGILPMSHGSLGEALRRAGAPTLGREPPIGEHVSVGAADAPESLLVRGREALARVDDGSGVLVLTDMFGATPANVAAKLLHDGKVEGLSGANLPMLVRALAHRDEPLAEAVQKARAGGGECVGY